MRKIKSISCVKSALRWYVVATLHIPSTLKFIKFNCCRCKLNFPVKCIYETQINTRHSIFLCGNPYMRLYYINTAHKYINSTYAYACVRLNEIYCFQLHLMFTERRVKCDTVKWLSKMHTNKRLCRCVCVFVEY